MARHRIGFETLTIVGYVVVVLLLSVGMSLSIRELSAAAHGQLARARTEEMRVTLIERLRWNSEAVVSNGRGFLASHDPALLAGTHRAVGRFDATLQTLLAQTKPQDRPLIFRVERTAREFVEKQQEIFSTHAARDEGAGIDSRFENELLPLRAALDDSLARLVTHEQLELAAFYEDARADISRLERGLYALLLCLVLAGLAVASYFARLLARSYRQERVASDVARRAVAARDQMMGIVAHDLRNPLGAIAMRAELLRSTGESQRVCAEAMSIGKAAGRMESLIKSMLDVTSIDAGKFVVVPEACEVDELIRDTVEMFENGVAAKQIRFEQRVADPRLAICADRERVLQVLSNLVGNALKFTPINGRVTLSVARREAHAEFSVRDTGPGIPREDLPHAFDRFWRAEAKAQKGTGLGLFIAKSIVDAHGGRIWVESEPGHGTAVRFTLPLVVRDREESGATHRARQARGMGGPDDDVRPDLLHLGPGGRSTT
jgi:signal transduction histidine kinase